MTALGEYEGLDVTQSTVRVTKAGDGLSEALEVAPVEYHIGDVVHLVLRTECVRVSHEPIKDSDDLRRVHTLATTEGTVVEAKEVYELLAASRAAIRAAQGVVELNFEGDE